MPTKTAKPKRKPSPTSTTIPQGIRENDPDVEEVDGDLNPQQKLLVESLESLSKQIVETGRKEMSDARLKQAIVEAWIDLKFPNSSRPGYCVKTYDPRWGICFWNRPVPSGEPRWHTGNNPPIINNLVFEVRSLFSIPGDASAEDHSSHDSHNSHEKNGNEGSDGSPIAVIVARGIDVELSLIDDSPWQTREEPSKESIAELAALIEASGQLAAMRVRRNADGRYEQIGGHRRKRALKHLKRTAGRCDVVECSDSVAAREVLVDNEQQPLNAIEKAKGYAAIWKEYEAAGKSQRQMARDLNLDQGTLNSQLRLLEAPEELQSRLIARDITQTQLRGLLPWNDRPAIVDRFIRELLDVRFCKSGPIDDSDWNRALGAAIEKNSRSIVRSAGNWVPSGTPLFDCKKHLQDLDIIEYSIDGRKQKRAFNLKLWNSLQNEAKKKKKEKQKAEASAPQKTRAVRTNRQGYEWTNAFKEAWCGFAWKRIHEAMKGSLSKVQKSRLTRLREYVSIEDSVPLEKSLTLDDGAWTNAQFQGLVKNFIPRYMQVPHRIEWKDVVAIAEYLQLDLREGWKPTADLLEACELLDLVDLLSEIEIEGREGKATATKPEIIKLLLAKWEAGHVPDFFSPDPKKKPAKKAKARK